MGRTDDVVLNRQIRPASVSSQRVPLWHRLPVDSERGGGMEARHYRQTNYAGHPRSPERPQP